MNEALKVKRILSDDWNLREKRHVHRLPRPNRKRTPGAGKVEPQHPALRLDAPPLHDTARFRRCPSARGLVQSKEDVAGRGSDSGSDEGGESDDAAAHVAVESNRLHTDVSASRRIGTEGTKGDTQALPMAAALPIRRAFPQPDVSPHGTRSSMQFRADAVSPSGGVHIGGELTADAEEGAEVVGGDQRRSEKGMKRGEEREG
ncbi:hypothetical protein B0H14DRAFT_2588036 [Mycena olivaceomarginata]|nr:hypothetical protein B0H14DRAFT_2588036 [Mycena olivaceomarginata]